MIRSLSSPSNLAIIKLNSSSRILLTSKQDVLNNQINQQSVRYARNIKPWKNGPIDDWKKDIYNYEYRRARAKKTFKIELPDFEKLKINEDDRKMTPSHMKSLSKEKGIVPNRRWIEKPIYIGDSSRILDEYVPPEGDGKLSVISKEGAGQRADSVKYVGKEKWATRKIRNYMDTFDPYDFALNQAQDIYIKAHEALANHDLEKLYTLVTDTCLPRMLFSTDLKTINWKYVKAIDLPRCVNVKYQEQDGIAFGQITVRFNTQQILAIYDKFGRLINGSEVIIKDVLDFIVFENRISSLNGVWRIHGKIVPEWNKTDSYSYQTSVLTA